VKIITVETSYSEGFDRKFSRNYQSRGFTAHRTVKLVANLEEGESTSKMTEALQHKAKTLVKNELKKDEKEFMEDMEKAGLVPDIG